MLRRRFMLLPLCLVALIASSSTKADLIYLDFETFPVDPDGPGGFKAGDHIPGGIGVAGGIGNGYNLNDAFRLLGLQMESTGGAGVQALIFPPIAVSGINWILAQPDKPSNIVFTFSDPTTGQKLTTDFFSLATDAQPDTEFSRLSAYDVDGKLIATTGIVRDTVSVTESLNVPGMHQVVFETVLGNPGIGVDDVRFNRPALVAVPEPSPTSAFLGLLVAGALLRKRRRKL